MSTPHHSPSGITIRDATADDMPAVCTIYGHEVRNGVATFEEREPTADEIEARRQAVVSAGHPYLVAEQQGQVVGYAYASPYRARPAYRNSVENSVYVDRTARRGGIAEALLKAVIARCEAAGRRQMIAVIAMEGSPDDNASVALHAKLGFRNVGTLEEVGFKFGRWIDTVIMQRPLHSEDAH